MRLISIEEEQMLQLGILRYVDDICKRENLKYFLAAGSCLGAVRDHGFIDWDDDIDIWMKREDYIKFGKVIKKYPNRKYFYQTSRTDRYFPIPGIARICINGTDKWRNENRKFHKGIFFDIFPLDFVDMDYDAIENKRNRLNTCRAILQHKNMPVLESVSIKNAALILISHLLVMRHINLNISSL